MRYLPLDDDDRAKMRDRIGVKHIDELFTDIPPSARLDNGLAGLPNHASEQSVERHFSKLAAQNVSAGSASFFCGAGAYRHHVPASVDHLIQRSEFLTAYTPYQPEIAQGTLQTLFEFQTQVAQITGMGVANASMYDGSTACAEAVLMAARITKRNTCLLASGLHPHYSAATQTLTHTLGVKTTALPPGIGRDAELIKRIDADTACIVVQSPNVFGEVVDLEPLAAAAHAQGALLIAVNTEVVSLGLLKSPGEMGADIVAAEGQSIGNALNFGGPYVGLLACRDERKFIRQAPGRFAGQTVDADGKRGFVLTLSTREQHIRREKATSNICTNSGLCTLAFTIHLALLGDKGLRHLAMLNHQKACALADQLGAIPGVTLLTPTFFNEFTLRLPANATEVIEKLAAKGILGGVPAARLFGPGVMDDLLIIAATETNTEQDMNDFSTALAEILS
ncbi:MAG: aminomethyl-transferring glycine dehydrogenase subunit GcvPA [Robiginitomaculum sp.]|nr:aminomethyl-transferring glycine dehydrogenase subunit GcvPA [Robiginitomaculum sp.]